jgi:hypothetical protein
MEALRLPEPLTHLKERQAPMSRLARTLALAAVLAAMILAGLTAAQAHTNDDPTTKRAGLAQERYYSTWSYGDTTASQDQPTSDSVKRAALAQERYYSTWSYGDPVKQAALAQERYYSTWSYGDTPAPVPAQPSGQPGWLLPTIGVLAAALALLGVLAATIIRRTRGRVRVRQAA